MRAVDPGRPSPPPRAIAWIACALLVLGVGAAFCNSFGGAFVFDDPASIADNLSLRQLWPPGPALSPPSGGRTVSGRPVLNFSLAVNYALSALNPVSYHAVNLAIHAGAALLVFGIVRRTLIRGAAPAPGDPGGIRRGARALPEATGLALAAALVWAVHPLQTESVTYIVQRAESLMGLFYLAAIYAFVRGLDSAPAGAGRASSRGWFGLAIMAALLGAGTKEVIVSVPVVALLYDRVFAAGSFREAWRQRRGVYLGLAASWLVLAYLLIKNPNRGGTAGLDQGWQSSWDYWATQGPAIVRYLRLSFWPAGQVIDYGFQFEWFRHPAAALPFDAAVLALLALTALAWRRWPSLAFLGTWFFAILAPTALIPGDRQTVVEHRMYLALAPVVVLAVLGLDWLFRRAAGPPRAAAATLATAGACAGVLALLSIRRNEVYRSDLALWADAVAKQPTNVFALNNLGSDLRAAGRLPEAITRFASAVQYEPTYVKGYINLGQCLELTGRGGEALRAYLTALQVRPDYPEGHANAGRLLLRAGRTREAVAELEHAVQLKPNYAEANNNLGVAYLGLDRVAEAEAQFTHAVAANPEYAEAQCNLGLALSREGRPAAAVAPLQATLRLQPDNPTAHFNLGLAFAATNRLPEAAAEFQAAVRLAPGNPDARNDLGSAWAELGRFAEAQEQFAAAVRLAPEFADAHHNLGLVLEQQGQRPEALRELRAAVRLDPHNAAFSQDLEQAARGSASKP